MRMSRFSTVVAAGVFLAACQTTQGPDGTVSINPVSGTSGGTPTYSVFWDQSDHLKELVAAKDWEKVAALYRKESAHFDKNRDDAAVVTGLRAAGDALARRLIPALDSATKSIDAISWPAPPSAWADIKQAIVGAKSELSATSDEPIIKEASAHNPAKERLTKAIAALEKRIGDGAPDGFAAFDHAGDGEFFAIYPVVVSVPETIRAAMPALTPKLNQQSPEVVAAFLQRFGDRLGQEARQDVSASGFQTLLRREARGERPTLDTILLAYGKAKQLGIEPTRLEEPRIRFVEITSRTLLKEGQIEFPATIDIDLPVDAEKAGLGEALRDVGSDRLDYLVVFDVAVAKSFRRVATQEKVRSQYKSGVRYEPNPARTTRQIAVQTAQANMQQVEIRASTGCIGCGLIPAMIHAGIMNGKRDEARQALSAAIANLEAEPVNLEKPVWADYEFNRAHIDAKKVMSINYYVMDLRERSYFKSFVTVNEEQSFVVPYKIHDKDRNRASHLTGAQREKDVETFEAAPVAIKLTEILGHYQENKGQSKKLPPASALRAEMLKDKNTQLAKYRENTFDARPLNDPRFDSVVVVYNPQGSVGSGFFVRPDMVLTNYHVIENSKFVEMKLYDGQETFGKVVKTDVRLDLALVRVQQRGKPVRLYNKRTVDLGVASEAIGHPNGLNFTITRGVVSAPRKLPSTFALGGKEILFVQTDAAINPGNSGGPLFIEDEVVGMNTQKLAKVEVEGLGFAIHFSEINAFMSGDF
jgi:serine protease Do